VSPSGRLMKASTFLYTTSLSNRVCHHYLRDQVFSRRRSRFHGRYLFRVGRHEL